MLLLGEHPLGKRARKTCPFKIEEYVCPPSSDTGYNGIPKYMRCTLRDYRGFPDDNKCVGEDVCPIMNRGGSLG